ncbi:MAG TPA: CCA tRNA nucleotidyltransferase [archaeon]|nr:CCA tRNA nucleotidyltransferase [archaeon]
MEKILKTVLKKITPTQKEISEQKKFAQLIISRIMKIPGKHQKAELVGSIGRSTHLAGDNDIDIFVFFPEELSREEFEKEGIRIGKAIFKGENWETAYSEHPYIRGTIGKYDVEIVPAYNVLDPKNMKSAVDRSPFHNQYIISQMISGQEQQVRLLKQFMKGIKCYGADLSSNGFPGYVAEILILKYGNFEKCIQEAAQWKEKQVVDLANYYTKEGAEHKFNTHFVVVDPVDKNRNVAAALSLNQYARFIAAARAFLEKPSFNFFFPKNHKPWSTAALKKFLKKTELTAIHLGYPKGAVEDVMWGSLRRLGAKIATQTQGAGFIVKRSSQWLEHPKHMAIILELESTKLNSVKVITGPSVMDSNNSMSFIKSHPHPLSGPRIENGRWVLEIEREHTQISQFLTHLFKKLKKEEKELIKKAISQRFQILNEKSIIGLYKKNKNFSSFLTAYLKGKEEFLER